MKATEAQLRAALDRADPAIRLFLLHGPDEAGADALAARLPRALGSGVERIDLDGATLKADPARLADEAAALSLFGDRRCIRVTGVGEESLAAIATLLEAPAAGNPVVAIAPGIKASGALVKHVLAHHAALAFACYVPEGRAAEGLATEIAREHGLRLGAGVALRLTAAAAGDRSVLTREIEKFALFLDADIDRPHDLDTSALTALGAGIDEGEVGTAVEALLARDAAVLGAELAALHEAGVSPVQWLRAIVRRLIAIAEMRGAVDAGEQVSVVMKRHRVFFREEASTMRAIRRWTPAMLQEAISRARTAERSMMSGAAAGDALAAQAMVDLARWVGARG